MRLIFTSLLTIILTLSGFAQVTNEGSPQSWKIESAKAVSAITLPSFDKTKLEKEDLITDKLKDRPFRFGYEFLVDYSTENAGTWETLANGDRIWRLRFVSEGAKTMNFVFTDFFMPAGATLYLYNNDRTDVLGAYTSLQNSEERVLGTWLVNGDDVWIEYYEPKAVRNQGSLQLTKVVHGYRGSNDFLKSPDDALNTSGICNYDVDCDMGNINALKDINKKSVGLIIVGNSGFCSGALINNTNNDGTPYFLTANHCSEGENISQWAFRFNWISPDPVCAQNQNSTNTFTYVETTSGASLRARRTESDFCLIRINGSLPIEWDVVYAGWNRGVTPPPFTFGIHHPSGDIMKACKDNNPPTSNNNGFNVWTIANWDLGVTEGGSSGSPLFDNNGRIIGQLFGGAAACNGTTDNNEYDEYGRLNTSWNTGNTASSRLRDWLDPINSNVTVLNYYSPSLGTENTTLAANEVTVYPNPSNGLFTVELGLATEGEFEVYNTLGQLVKSGKLMAASNPVIDLGAMQNGLYMVKIKDNLSGKSKSLKLIME